MTTIDLYTGHHAFEQLPVEFSASVEHYEREPYSWGEGRGSGAEMSVTITRAKLGGEWLGRATWVRIVGDAQVVQAEAWLAEMAMVDAA